MLGSVVFQADRRVGGVRTALTADPLVEQDDPVISGLNIFRLFHAVHVGGGPAGRNLLEGRPRQVLAILDTLAPRP